MWCEMVGCVRPRPAVKSQMHIGAAAFHREATMVRRVGSASAFNSAALISAQSPLTRGSSQHTPRSRMTGSSLTATTRMLQYPSTIIDGFGRGKPMSEIKEGVSNATFMKGSIDDIPLPDASVDVVISNCVINLAEDKAAVIREAHRVLRPGGRLAVADMVELEPLDAATKKRLDTWAGCISGTIPIDEYRAILLAAGFEEPEVEVHATQVVPGVGAVGSAYIRARKA